VGDFTKNLLKGGNDRTARSVPVGSHHYDMGGISFYLDQTPKEVLGGLLRKVIQQMQDSGQFEQARKMIENPQPFTGQPVAMAVFMAACLELEQKQEQIDALRDALARLGDIVIGMDEGLKVEVDAALKPTKPA
jgi:hypothetical protein